MEFWQMFLLAISFVMAGMAFHSFRLLQGEPAIETIPPDEIPQRYKRYRENVLQMTLFAYAAVLLLGSTLPPVEDISPLLAAALFVIFHLLASLRMVGAQEFGAVLLYGKPLYPLDSGLRFIPWLIGTIAKETRLVIEDERPADPEKIFRVGRDQPETIPLDLQEKGYRPPIRITFAGIEKEEKTEGKDGELQKKERSVDDPLEERITAETPIVLRWQINDFLKFLVTVEDREDARRQMEDVAVAVLSQHFTQVTVAQALQSKKTYDDKLQKALQDATANWGVVIHMAAVKNIILSRELNVEVQRIAEARAKRRRDILEGEGLGARERAILDGRTEGLRHMAEQTGVDAEVVFASETARAITDNESDRLIIAGGRGFADIAGAASVLADEFRRGRGRKARGKRDREERAGAKSASQFDRGGKGGAS